jgi:hypothetical protein
LAPTPATAVLIVVYRQKNGGLKKIEDVCDLRQVLALKIAATVSTSLRKLAKSRLALTPRRTKSPAVLGRQSTKTGHVIRRPPTRSALSCARSRVAAADIPRK